MRPEEGDQEFEMFIKRLFDRDGGCKVILSPGVDHAAQAIAIKALRGIAEGSDPWRTLLAIFHTGFNIGWETAEDWNEYKAQQKEKTVVH